MKNIIQLLLGILLISISCSSEKSLKANKITSTINDLENIQIINEILKDTQNQLPYIDNSFYVFHDDYIKDLSLSKEEFESLIQQKKYSDAIDFTIKEGDIQFYDTLSNKSKNSIIIKTKEEGYNKYVLQISRPFKLNENKIIIFYYGTKLFYRDNHEGPVVGGIGAELYIKRNGKWKAENYYSIADLS